MRRRARAHRPFVEHPAIVKAKGLGQMKDTAALEADPKAVTALLKQKPGLVMA